MDKKLNILYVANSRIPTEKAHGKQIVETCRALADQDCHVLLLLPARINRLKNDLFDFYKVRRNFTVKKLPCLDLLWLPFGKGFFFFVQSATFALAAIIFYFARKNKFDAVYTRDFMLAAVFLTFARKIFFEVHTIPNRVRFYHNIIWQKLTGLLAISNGIKNELKRPGISDTKVLVARDGVDIENFDISISSEEARKQLGLNLNKRIVVYTGHLYDWKGADLLACAAKDLSDTQIYLVGGTADDIKVFRSKFKAPNLFIVGYRSPQEIPFWLKAADLLVLPNKADKKISSHYTSPLKLFEYMASGTPIIASDLSSLKEVIGSDEAVFFNPRESGSLAKVIKNSLGMLPELTDKAKLAKNKIIQYTWRERSILIKNFIEQNLYAKTITSNTGV